MTQFTTISGPDEEAAKQPSHWSNLRLIGMNRFRLVAQAISEILPDGEREKQLMQGLLNQKEGLEEATRQGELF